MTGDETGQAPSSSKSEAQELQDFPERAKPTQTPNVRQLPVLDKAALVEKAMQKARLKAQEMTHRQNLPHGPQK
jgi:hypothetical protein